MDGLNDFDDDLKDNPYTQKDNKKILLFLVPALIVIGIIVGLYFLFIPKSDNAENLSYSIVEKEENDTKTITVFYDLPEISVQLQSADSQNAVVKIKINIELSKMGDIKTIESLMPQITDAAVTHISELSQNEISGAEGLYWLKEELLYRLSLIAAPVKISNLNFKRFEIQKTN